MSASPGIRYRLDDLAPVRVRLQGALAPNLRQQRLRRAFTPGSVLVVDGGYTVFWRPGMAPVGLRMADPDRLDVAELADALREELPAVPGTLDAPERQLRVGGDVAVDEDHARRQVPAE